MIEAVHAHILREQQHVQLPEQVCGCKDPHVRVRHDHDLLCTEVPRLACELERMAQSLSLPTAPELYVSAFYLRRSRRRAPQIIDVEASCDAVVCEARKRGWTPFEDGSASVESVVLVLTGVDNPFRKALLALSAIETTPGRTAIRELAEVVYFAGSRLRAIADLVRGRQARSIVEHLRDLGESLHALDARIRETCLFDPTPRGRHSRDLVYQEVVSALADADFSVAEIARFVVPTSRRDDDRVWKKRIGEHLRNADKQGLGTAQVDSLGTSFRLGVPSRFQNLRHLN
jgi:hypothetical protein